MKQISGKQFCRMLEAGGWLPARVRGSHRVYVKKGVNARISVPVHGNKPLKKGLMSHLAKVAGISLGF